MPDDVVRIDGLAEFRRGLKQAQSDLPRALSEAHKKVANVVVAGAQPLLTSKTGKPQGAVTIAASGTQGGAFIKLRGGAAYGAEFGAKKYTQFKPHKGHTGYAVYPTVRSKRDEINGMYLDAVDEAVTKRAFPE